LSTWTEKKIQITRFKEGLLDTERSLRANFRLSSNDDELDDEQINLRPINQAEIILGQVESIYEVVAGLFDEFPTLESLYENEIGSLRDLIEEDALAEICFIDDYIYPANEALGINVDGIFNDELVTSHIQFISDWAKFKKSNHVDSQEIIKSQFDINLNSKKLPCLCVGCTADFRTKVREHIISIQKETIQKGAEVIYEQIVNRKIDMISDTVFNLRKQIDQNYTIVKKNLRKGSLNKLQAEVKSYYKEQFDATSELGKVYKEKIKAFLNSTLIEEGFKPEIIADDEFDRFYEQLHTNIWKPARFLKREFKKLINSIMTFKRKDISATILKDYLGQFWIHSDARRLNRKIIYHMGPTNSGKTYHAIEALTKAKTGCYLAPLRLLASELYDTMNSKGSKTNLLTGEEVIEVEGATHYSSTIEMAKLNQHFDCCVIDEIQMITDSSRGWAWTRALINLNCPEIHICGDPSVLELIKKILKLTGDSIEVKEYTRMTELKVLESPLTLSKLEKNDALIVFSRRNALKYKSDLERLDFKVSIIYGRLSPEVRREQARKFNENETDIMVSTDAIAMGMNLPVKRIVFSALSKFYDSQEHPLTASELKQIAGRAGRFKKFPTGYVTCLEKEQEGLDIIKLALNSDLEQCEMGMVGPDLDIYSQVNDALIENNLNTLSLSEFLQLFNTMTFEKPFYCVELKEMIEIAETVEDIDKDNMLTDAEIFGFTCAPVNLGLKEHLEYFVTIVTLYVNSKSIYNQEIDSSSDNIDYLETAIKCVELYQWLSRHFDDKNFDYTVEELSTNKGMAIEKLNQLLSERLHKNCSSCGLKMSPDFNFNICEKCFSERKFTRYKRNDKNDDRSGRGSKRGSRRGHQASASDDKGSRPKSKGGFKGKSKKKPGEESKASKLTKHR
jgi:ATP-dependent RNA helicase SUPV3L1/SUV3